MEVQVDSTNGSEYVDGPADVAGGPAEGAEGFDHHAAAPVTARFDEHPCNCVENHNPNPTRTQRHHVHPLGWGGPDTPDNVVYLCGTSHDNVHDLLNAYKRVGDLPAWSIRSKYSPYLRDLAEQGWQAYQESLR